MRRMALLIAVSAGCMVMAGARADVAGPPAPTTAPAIAPAVNPQPATAPAAADVGPIAIHMPGFAPVVVQGAATDADPINDIAVAMGDASHDLGGLQTGQPVQVKEQKVVGQLDVLIAELEKRIGSGGGSARPTIPLGDSRIVKGPGGSGPLHDPRAGTKLWGQLPPKERERILQSQNEGFPAGYESILASYYSRLAEGQPGEASSADGGEGAAPSTQPSRP